jgi:enolase-phosphatase E1
MDQDRKSTALKNIQGRIWLEGYQRGELRGEVFPDVPPALERWHQKNIDIRIFSSGSVLAQRLLFSTTMAGDLTKFLNGYFDTTTGPKTDPASYRQIAKNFGVPASGILFISDVTRELDAARQAGMKTLLCIRPGNHPQPLHDHSTIMSFDQME